MAERKLQQIEDLTKRLSIVKEEGNRAEQGAAYGDLGNAFRGLGKFQEAIEYHNKALSIAKEVGDRALEARAYGNLGNAYESLGKFQEAIEYHNKALSIAKEVGDRAGEGRAHGGLGNAYANLGKFQEAIEYHNKALSIAKEVGDRALEARAYGNLGNAYESLGKFQEAIEYHSKALSIAKEVGDRAGEGRAHGGLGNAYANLGKFQEAIEYHNKALSIAKEVGDRALEARAYGNLGNAYESLGKFQEAIEYHSTALSIATEVGDRAEEGGAHGGLGNAYESLGKFQEAIEYHNKALSIAKEVGDRALEARAYGNLGNAYESLGKFQEAIEYHSKALSIAKEVGDRAEEGRAHGGLGNAYESLGKFQEAIEYHNKALSIAKEVGDRALEARAYGNLGNAYESLGKFQEAKECYQSSVEVLDIIRVRLKSEDALKISFRDLYHDAYDRLWKTLLRLDLPDEALFSAERGRAQALVDGLKIQYGLTALPSVSLEPKETISYISNEFPTTTVFLELERKVITFWVIRKNNTFEVRQREIEGRRKNEDSVTLLLETTLKEIGAGVGVRCGNWSLKPHDDSPVIVRPSSVRRDDESAQTSECTVDSLQRLHDAIIGPIADLCEGEEMVIVPKGPLCLAPFSALSKSIRIRTVPSLTSLKLITDSPEDYHTKSGALIVGDPCLKQVTNRWGDPKFKELKYARQEAKMIGDILKIPPLTGTEATKNKVLERITSVALVHIAGHGLTETGEIPLAPNAGWENDPDQEPRSEIKIPKEEDYILKMSDVLGLRQRARLVVLSCSHSGRGEVHSEGVVGIARAFLAAGARSVLATLWTIGDEPTMEFMKIFYQHLKDGERTSVSLHKAMEALRESEKFCATKYWAPFVLIGDDVTLEF